MGADPAEKGERSAVAALHLLDVHDLGLEGVEDVHPDLDQLGEQLVDFSAAMDENPLSFSLYQTVQRGHPRLDELPPQRRAHEQAPLLAPVVPEAHPVDVEAQGLPDDLQVVLENSVEQAVGERFVEDHGDQKLFHAGQGPSALEQREGDGGHREAISLFPQRGREVREAHRRARVGKSIATQCLGGDPAVADGPDVRVDAPVPLYAELVLPDPGPAGKLAFGQPGAQDGQAVAEGGLEVGVPVVAYHLLARGCSEGELIRGTIRLAMLQRGQHPFPRGHAGLRPCHPRRLSGSTSRRFFPGRPQPRPGRRSSRGGPRLQTGR